MALLGHGARKADAPPLMSTTDWMARRVVDRRRPTSQKSVRGAFRATRTLVELRFAWPRRVHGLDGLQISQIACGERHTAFLTQEGSLYTCGDGLALLGADETTERARKVGEVVRDEEGPIMKDDMMEERRTWFTNELAMGMEFPENLERFYLMKNLQTLNRSTE